MTNEDSESRSATTIIFEQLAAATKQYRDYVDLAQIGEASARRAAEIRSYDRTWSHPLGLVLHKK
jgi:hypothetical protein